MTISFDFHGCYLEHKDFFDEMSRCMQKEGHKVGIVTGEREAKKDFIANSLGFKPDFVHLWGDFESIGSGAQWKIQKLADEQVTVHFDDDATELKKWTEGWIIKTMCSGEKAKF